MYAFVMRPESLPRSYQDFIQKTGPVAEPVYKAVRDNCRGCAVDVATLSSYLSGRKGFSSINLVEFPSIIPCSIIHPDTKSCLAHNATAASDTFRKTFPLYFSLTFVPFVVLRLNKVPSFLLLFFFFVVFGIISFTSCILFYFISGGETEAYLNIVYFSLDVPQKQLITTQLSHTELGCVLGGGHGGRVLNQSPMIFKVVSKTGWIGW